jgi:hypothetical protein
MEPKTQLYMLTDKRWRLLTTWQPLGDCRAFNNLGYDLTLGDGEEFCINRVIGLVTRFVVQ